MTQTHGNLQKLKEGRGFKFFLMDLEKKNKDDILARVYRQHYYQNEDPISSKFLKVRIRQSTPSQKELEREELNMIFKPITKERLHGLLRHPLN